MAEREGAPDGKVHATSATPDGMSSFDDQGQVLGSECSAGSLPMFNTWTQFSGMPTHNVSESAGTFAWDVFTPNGTSNSSYGASLGDLDSQADFMTAYQNYIAAAQQMSPELHTPDSVLQPPQTSFNVQEASQEGKQLYGEAVSNWNSFSTYDPFGTPDPLPKAPSSDHKETKKSGGQSGSNSKPTYSDIAKTLKTKPIQRQASKDKEEIDTAPRRMPDPVIVRPFKPIVNRRAHSARQHSKGQASVADDMESTVSPDSKYGLDQFEEVFPGTDSIGKQSDSLESLPTMTRKGSTSSISSGTSGIEEIHMTSRSSAKEERSRSNSDGFDGGFASTSKSSNKPFFDARRIFQGKDKRSSCNSSAGASGSTMLNNGKPACGSKSSSHKKTTDYINNDLRDSRKRTNHNSQSRDTDSRKAENLTQNGKVDRKSRYAGCQGTDPNDGEQNNQNRMFLHTTFDQEYIDEWISITCEKLKSACSFLWSSFVTFILLLFGIIVYLVSGCVHVIGIVWTKTSHFVKTRLLKKYFAESGSWHDRKNKIGLEENITLPSTGDEAMQRLLSCKGKDPYSILGLRCDACDDDIRKYYKKQAVLVHPDKNKQPGAEEAFKILGHAFELIGEPEKRRSYDFEATEVEVVMKDLLTKLQEAANMMRCDNCGGKHKRVAVDRPWYSARFCKRCNIRHSAKEGDVWAETTMFGFLWHYYACMEGQIYDITEWVSCKKDFFKHMQASAHHVFYRIATEGNRSNSSHQRSGEADLEDLINHLFHQAMHTDGSGNQWQQPQSPASSSSQNSSNWSSTSGTGNTNKKNRRRKKKH